MLFNCVVTVCWRRCGIVVVVVVVVVVMVFEALLHYCFVVDCVLVLT